MVLHGEAARACKSAAALTYTTPLVVALHDLYLVREREPRNRLLVRLLLCEAVHRSIGVAEAPADIQPGTQSTLDGFAAIADRRLYDAKTHGRNRVVSDDRVHLAAALQGHAKA